MSPKGSVTAMVKARKTRCTSTPINNISSWFVLFCCDGDIVFVYLFFVLGGVCKQSPLPPMGLGTG
jgi:hypothetical protein